MKKAISILLAAVMLLCALSSLTLNVFAEESVTLSTTDTSAAYNNLNTAIKNTPDGGTITILGTYTMPSSFSWVDHIDKSVTISGGTIDMSAVSTLNIRDGVTFTNTNLKWGGTIYACGNPVKVDSNVTVTGTPDAIYGGGNGGTVGSTSLTILAGDYKNIYGGGNSCTVSGNTYVYVGGSTNSNYYTADPTKPDPYSIYGGGNKGTVNGDTYVYIGGNTNSACDTSNHSKYHLIYGGGKSDTISGDTHIIFSENAKASYIYGGSYGSGAVIGGTAYLNVTGGSMYSIYGAGRNVDCVGNTVTTITGGTFHQIFGGSEESNVTGNVTLRVLGGTITRRIYGGCYNEATRSGLSMVWSGENHVTGTIKLVMGNGANVTYSDSDNDRAVYARTRHKDKIDGNAQIYYLDSSAKKEGHDPNDKVYGIVSTESLLSIDKADKTHKYLTHSANGNTITETCSCGCDHTATATLKLYEGASLEYTGEAIEPMFIEYSDSWLGEPLSTVSYSNNILPGNATASAVFTRLGLTVTESFNISIGEKEHLLAIANGTLSDTLTLSSDISLPECDAELLCRIIDASDSEKIIFGNFKLTDLSINISNSAHLSSIRNYTVGSFTLTDDIDLGGISLTSPLLTLNNSNLSGNGHAIYNYSVNDCGLIDVSGNTTVSSVTLGKVASAVSAVSSGLPTAALAASIPEGATLTVSDITVYMDVERASSVGGVIGSESNALTATNITYFDGEGNHLMVADDGLSIIQGTPIICGIQTGQTKTVTGNGDTSEVFSIRFIASIDNTLDYKRLGMSIQVDDGEATDINTAYVYTSLLENIDGNLNKVTAQELGGAYVYAIIISDIPVCGLDGNRTITFTVTPYATDNDGNEYVGEAITATYVNGEYSEGF